MCRTVAIMIICRANYKKSENIKRARAKYQRLEKSVQYRAVEVWKLEHYVGRLVADYFGGKRNWKEKISFGNLQTSVCAAVSL